ncbi:hypothetical protein [Nannocystis sp. SCPEA4]|uniref:hypothetical protein n=1 Tax=Nannocystis sp. SCPEA4 TaxID=2996787 RepID=UPI00226F31B8|nr:hypothetical protein [Nannocystis sp. SCPEA4]MCY1059102.1 hypothetical protein [Nannocystis sp. SCPEA4]
MAVSWTLYNNFGGVVGTPTGTLSLSFDNSGYPYYSGQKVRDAYAEVDNTGPVTINLSAQNAGYTLDQTLSDPKELPSSHPGVLNWSTSGAATVLTFTASSTVNDEWAWGFGGLTPAIGLKMKVRVRRI